MISEVSPQAVRMIYLSKSEFATDIEGRRDTHNLEGRILGPIGDQWYLEEAFDLEPGDLINRWINLHKGLEGSGLFPVVVGKTATSQTTHHSFDLSTISSSCLKTGSTNLCVKRN